MRSVEVKDLKHGDLFVFVGYDRGLWMAIKEGHTEPTKYFCLVRTDGTLAKYHEPRKFSELTDTNLLLVTSLPDQWMKLHEA